MNEERFTARRLAVLLALSLAASSAKPAEPQDSVPLDAERATQPQAWESIGLSGGGAMFTPVISPVDPNLILLTCDMSGVYRSTNGGKQWQLIHYRELTSSLVAPAWHPTNAGVAFAAGGWGKPLKMTQDRGNTWQEVVGSPSPVDAIGIDPGHPALMLLGSRRRIFRSADGGKNWQETGTVRGRWLGFHFDQTSPAERRTCLAATPNGIFRSDDAGVTWREVGPGPTSAPIVSFAAGSNPESRACLLYCTIESREVNSEITGGLYRSEDRGATWTRAMGRGIDLQTAPRGNRVPEPAQYEFVVTTDMDPSRVYVQGWGGRVFRSDDRGASWRMVLHQHISDPEFNMAPNYLLDEEGVYGAPFLGLGINPANPDQVIGTDCMNCFTTSDGGKSWAAAHTQSAEPASRRGRGLRWLNNGLVVTTVWHYYLDPFEPDRRYIAYTDLGFARSTDAGKSWYLVGRILPVRSDTYELAFDPEIPGEMWAAESDLHDVPNANIILGAHYNPRASGGVILSTNFAVTWVDASQGLPHKPITSVVVDPKSPKQSRTLYASAFEDGVYKSTDGAKSWAKSSAGLGAPEVNMRTCRIILHSDGTLFCLVTALRKDGHYLAKGPGLYRSTDGGSSWQWINASRPLLWPKDFDVDPRDSRVVYLGACDADNAEGGLYKTSDGGANWSLLIRKGADCFGATVDPRNPDRVYLCLAENASGDAGLWLSQDAGKTWKAMEGMPFRNAQRVTFDPKDRSVIYVSTFGASVWKGPAEP